jgi:hypothetical protein
MLTMAVCISSSEDVYNERMHLFNIEAGLPHFKKEEDAYKAIQHSMSVLLPPRHMIYTSMSE